MKKQIVSIFSGIDILGMGFEKNFETVLAVEVEEHACRTLKRNKAKYRPNLTVWNRDIFKVTDEEILKYQGVSGLIGGPPCQAVSSAAHGFDPTSKKLDGIYEYVRWVRLLKPDFFLFENADGLLQGAKKEIYAFIKKQLQSLGYDVKEKVMNCHEHGCVQTRKRIIAVGFRKELKVGFSFPEPVPLKDRKYVRDIIKEEPLGECLSYSEERRDIMTYVPEGGNWKSLPTKELKIRAMGEKNFYNPEGGMTGSYRRLHRDMPCPTLVTDPTQRNTLACHPTEHRPLSVNEYKRAFGLPEDYEVLGTIKEKYKSIGNGVPVELGRAMSDAILASYHFKVLSEGEFIKPVSTEFEQLRFA